jgi:hypothetical protein
MRALGIGTLMAVIATALATQVIWAAPAVAQNPGYERDHGSWKYRVGQTNGNLFEAQVWYDMSSVAALKSFAAANQAIAAQIKGSDTPIDVAVTFRAPLPLDTFRPWAKSTGMKVDAVDIRTTTATGERGTIGIFPHADDPLPQAALDGQLASASGKVGKLSVGGVTTVHGSIRSSSVAQLMADNQVFLVDVTAAVIRAEFASAGIVAADQLPAARLIVISPPPFWQMEELGLQNFR